MCQAVKVLFPANLVKGSRGTAIIPVLFQLDDHCSVCFLNGKEHYVGKAFSGCHLPDYGAAV